MDHWLHVGQRTRHLIGDFPLLRDYFCLQMMVSVTWPTPVIDTKNNYKMLFYSIYSSMHNDYNKIKATRRWQTLLAMELDARRKQNGAIIIYSTI